MEKRKWADTVAQGFIVAGLLFSQTALAVLKEISPLVRAIITVESSCRTNAVNEADGKAVKVTSYGIGQITLATAESQCGIKNVEKLYDKAVALRCTKKIVARLLNKYQDETLAIAAYNLGQPCQCNGEVFRYPNGKVCGKACSEVGSHRNAKYIDDVQKVLQSGKFCKI